MYYLLLQNYNNYRNRTYKRLDTAAEYKEAVETYYENVVKSTNFDISDSINMEHVFNGSFSGEPDYLLLLSETDSSIDSRWFVIEWQKIRGNQYRAMLRRDLLADDYETITEAPAFIEKGYVPSTDSAVFNKEDMTFNQIKQSETLLIDDSKTSWIVGYIAPDHPAISDRTFTVDPDVDMTLTGDFSDWAYADICNGSEHLTINPTDTNQYVKFWLYYNNVWSERNKCYTFNKTTTNTYMDGSKSDHFRISKEDWDNIPSGWHSHFDWDTILSKIYLDNPSWVSQSDFNYIYSLIGKNIQFQDGIYKIGIGAVYEGLGETTWQNSGNLFSYIADIIANDLAPHGIESVAYYPVSYKMMLKHFTFTATKVTDVAGTYKYSIPQTVKKLEDAPYKMFAIPYYKYKITSNPRYLVSFNGSSFIYCDDDLMLAWAVDISKAFGSSIYDLQILPYCPLSNWRGRSGTTNAGVWAIGKTEHVDYEYITETIESTTYNRGVIFFCDVSTKEQVLNADAYKTVITDYKISNETEFYRLCSPNYASVFEFSPAKNNGVEGYNVRYTYKPYQPFVNVAPIFGRLYGKDFNDNRGLILSGDFSLPIVSDAWTNYQLQNKNYQLAFDRQIENMEVNYKWQRTQGVASAIVGTIQGGATGMAAGGMAGGVPGAIAGAVIGTAASAVGGAVDLQMQQALHDESIDFAKDNFGYQLGNIKALPNTINKISSLVANSKFFPFIEKYSCTEEEKEALRNKIKYNGMSIGRIGRILDFLNPSDTTYVKGQIIRLEGNFDAHTANQISEEFNKGWYI